MYELDYEIKRERAYERKLSKSKKEMTARQWVNQDRGSANCRTGSFDNIFSAYHDFRNSQQWNLNKGLTSSTLCVIIKPSRERRKEKGNQKRSNSETSVWLHS